MGEHRVAFNIGTDHVVCTCGSLFRTPSASASSWSADGLQQWANHLSATNTATTLEEAWDEGFTACAHEHMRQRDEPSHPITRTNPFSPERAS